jgi:hypothetical protein
MAVACLAACAEGPPVEPGPEPPAIPPPTSPENLVRAIEVIYNDRVRSAAERVEAYAALLAPDFVYQPSPGDLLDCLPDGMGLGLAHEIAIHEALFEAQASGEVEALELRITSQPAEDLEPPPPGREGWKRVACTIDLRLIAHPDHPAGPDIRCLARRNGLALLLAAPSADRSRWFIAEWVSLRP